jgi:hypothetical protein
MWVTNFYTSRFAIPCRNICVLDNNPKVKIFKMKCHRYVLNMNKQQRNLSIVSMVFKFCGRRLLYAYSYLFNNISTDCIYIFVLVKQNIVNLQVYKVNRNDFDDGSRYCGRNSNSIIPKQNRKLYFWRWLIRWSILSYDVIMIIIKTSGQSELWLLPIFSGSVLNCPGSRSLLLSAAISRFDRHIICNGILYQCSVL